jgi:hypothetical protein
MFPSSEKKKNRPMFPSPLQRLGKKNKKCKPPVHLSINLFLKNEKIKPVPLL